MKKLFFGIVFLSAIVLGSSSALATYLIYESGTSQNEIANAMDILRFSYDVRNAANPVTAADLTSYDALIVGWASDGIDMSGLNPKILTGITGNRILTMHDADFHTSYRDPAAEIFMERAVLFAAAADDIGLLAFPVALTDPFSYLPAAWVLVHIPFLNKKLLMELQKLELLVDIFWLNPRRPFKLDKFFSWGFYILGNTYTI